MKVLSIYRNDDGIVLERKNDFGSKFRRVFENVEAMLEHLEAYKTTGEIYGYKLDVSNEFRSIVIHFLNIGQFSDKEVKIGRRSLGVTKKVSITLAKEYWEMLDILQDKTGSTSRSEILRKILTITLDYEVKSQIRCNKMV